MNLIEALTELRDGKRIREKGESLSYLFCKGGVIYEHYIASGYEVERRGLIFRNIDDDNYMRYTELTTKEREKLKRIDEIESVVKIDTDTLGISYKDKTFITVKNNGYTGLQLGVMYSREELGL